MIYFFLFLNSHQNFNSFIYFYQIPNINIRLFYTIMKSKLIAENVDDSLTFINLVLTLL